MKAISYQLSAVSRDLPIIVHDCPTCGVACICYGGALSDDGCTHDCTGGYDDDDDDWADDDDDDDWADC